MGTNRRELLLAGAGLAAGLLSSPQARAQTARSSIGDGPDWTTLESRVEGRLALVEWPLEPCLAGTGRGDCAAFFASARNPYFLGDHPALTQTLGWADAWVSKPSERVLEAASAADIAAAIRFARDHGVRLVVKGGWLTLSGNASCWPEVEHMAQALESGWADSWKFGQHFQANASPPPTPLQNFIDDFVTGTDTQQFVAAGGIDVGFGHGGLLIGRESAQAHPTTQP